MEQEEENKQQYPPIVDQIREYAETRIKLSKYKLIEKSTAIISGIIITLVIALCFILTFLFASFTLALFLGKVLGSYWEGFGIVALIYLAIALVAMASKTGFKKPLVNMMIKMLFNDN